MEGGKEAEQAGADAVGRVRPSPTSGAGALDLCLLYYDRLRRRPRGFQERVSERASERERQNPVSCFAA